MYQLTNQIMIRSLTITINFWLGEFSFIYCQCHGLHSNAICGWIGNIEFVQLTHQIIAASSANIDKRTTKNVIDTLFFCKFVIKINVNGSVCSINIFFPTFFSCSLSLSLLISFPWTSIPVFTKCQKIAFFFCMHLSHSLFLSLFLLLRLRLAVFVCSSLLLVQIIHTWVVCMPHPVHNGKFLICCLKCIWYRNNKKKSKAPHKATIRINIIRRKNGNFLCKFLEIRPVCARLCACVKKPRMTY